MSSESNKRLAKNTVILYLRMFLIMAIGLYTSRVVLRVLGVEDFGVYNAVGGFVAMFSLLSGTLTNAINRFLAFELGRGDRAKLVRVFSTSLNVMMMLSGVIIILGACIGLWFVSTQMSIPEGRGNAALWVLGCSLLTFAINLISVPYNAAIVAHERMSAFAYISLAEAALKLLIVYALTVSPVDKLKTYAVLMLAVAALTRLLYGIYCKRHFEECTYHLIYDGSLLREMTSFAGWNFVASSAGLINNSGVNLLMNIFFGVTVNAARGIAVQVSSSVTTFVSNFMMALNPQITKTYAQGDLTSMHALVCRGAKFGFFLTLFIVIPLCLETRYVLHLWLGIVPNYTVPFVSIALIATSVNVLSNTLITAVHATGNIKRFMIVTGAVEFMCFPLTYVAFKMGSSPTMAYYIYTVVYLVLMVLRLLLVKGLIGMKGRRFFKDVYFRVGMVSVMAVIVPTATWMSMDEGFVRLLTVCIVSTVSTSLCVWFAGLDREERSMVMGFIKRKISRK